MGDVVRLRAEDSMTELFGPPIFKYTRGQAIRNGLLVEVTDVAREAGFRGPVRVALTLAAWEECVRWSSHNLGLQDEAGRLWDVVWMARDAVRRTSMIQPGDRVPFVVLRVPNTARATQPRRAQLVLVAGWDDDGETPAATIMLPGED